MKTLALHDGGRMPAFGLGTWKSAPGDVGRAVRAALELGYRHIDCAWIYGNEGEIGEALSAAFRDGVVSRDDLWITSKLWNDRHAPEDVEPALRESLTALGIERLDLYLIHWPVAHERGKILPDTGADMIGPDRLPIAATWEALEQTVDAGLTRYIGVSNFSRAKLAALIDGARIRPAVDQVEMHPYLAQPDLVDFCRRERVVVTAYSPLGSPDRPDGMRKDDEPRLLEDPAVVGVAERHGVHPAQVLIAWALARDTVVIPKSVNPERIAQNLAATGLELSADDVAALDALDRGRRYVDGSFWELPDGPYTLASLWDEA